MTTLPPEFWANERENMLAVILPRITDLAVAGISLGSDRLARLGISFDNALAHQRAMEWARSFTDNLLNLVGTTTQRTVGAAVENWLATPGATRADLERRLAPILQDNVSRAGTVAVTEVTRAVAQGNIIAFTEAGAQVPPMWSDVTGTRPFGPPLHVNCRCDTAFIRYKGEYIIVWVTNRDELVCTRQTETPIGVVAGCRYMHGRCISQGQYLGHRVL